MAFCFPIRSEHDRPRFPASVVGLPSVPANAGACPAGYEPWDDFGGFARAVLAPATAAEDALIRSLSSEVL